jgi:hypothetical protein
MSTKRVKAIDDYDDDGYDDEYDEGYEEEPAGEGENCAKAIQESC